MGAAMGSPIVCCPSCPVGLFRVLRSPCQQRVLLWEPGSSFMQQISWGAPGKPQGTGVRHHQALPVRDLGGAPGLCGAAISPGLQAESLLLPPSLPHSAFFGSELPFYPALPPLKPCSRGPGSISIGQGAAVALCQAMGPGAAWVRCWPWEGTHGAGTHGRAPTGAPPAPGEINAVT